MAGVGMSVSSGGPGKGGGVVPGSSASVGFGQLGRLVAVHCGLSGAVDDDGFRTESGETCACIISC